MMIPKGLKRVVRYSCLKKIIVFILILTGMCVAITFINNELPQPFAATYKVSSYIFCAFIAIWIAFFRISLFDKTFYGKVVKVDVKTTVDNFSSVKPTQEGLYYKNTVYLRIKTNSGKTTKRKVGEARARLQSVCDIYQAGDMVFHLYGSKHIIVIPTESNDSVRCCVCGDANHKNDTVCRSCAHTLVTSFDK